MAPRDVVYASPGADLLARIHEPPPAAATGAAVIDVHGGSWSAGDRTLGAVYCEALAARGFVVAAIDFRQGPDHRHPAASEDIAAAVRWLRARADDVGVDGDRIGLTGSSSGGHLALHAAMTRLAPGEGVRCVAALWPPVDPLRRYRYAQEAAATGEPASPRFRPHALVQLTEAYFGDEATMAAASIAAIVRSGGATHLPPLWVVYPELDLNVPRPLIDDLEAAWRAAGGHVEVTVYPGQEHAFGHLPGPATDAFVDDLARFLRTHLDH